MPTIRFYKLRDEKKRRIRDAAFLEFTRVPMDRVSINRIVRDAGISRGSYYTYFENKWDILIYLLEEAAARLYQCAENSLAQSDGNFWRMLEMLLNQLLELCREADNSTFLKNILGSSNLERIHREFMYRRRRAGSSIRQSSLEESIYRQCAGNSIVRMEREEFSVLFQMAIVLLGFEVRRYLEGDSVQAIQRRFHLQLRMLRHGVSLPSKKEAPDREKAPAAC